MASVGIGYRIAADILFEMSMHLCQPAVYQALTFPVTAGLGVTAQVGSTAAMYPGAQLVVEQAGNAAFEVITVIAVLNVSSFTANFAHNHSIGAPVWGATFPTQQGTDPIFTQAEMLGYLSRAQNEFLAAVPCYYARFLQTVNPGQIYQTTPPTAILIDRVASSSLNIGITSLSRAGNVVTLTSGIQHGLSQYSTFAVANPNSNLTDTSFLGVFAVQTAPTPTTLTYVQAGANASATGGNMQSMLRLYELTQEELVQRNRNWQVSYAGPLQSWFEDRAGLYKWGVGGLPPQAFPVELLCAIRDTDTLAMGDGFLVPDLCIHGVKWLSVGYAFQKDGIYQQPELAAFCFRRYAQVVMATQRYIRAMKMQMGK